MSNCMMPQGHQTHCGCEPERNPFFNPEPAASLLRERAKLAQPAEAEGDRIASGFVILDGMAFSKDEILAQRFDLCNALESLSVVTAERDRLESMLIRTATRHFALQIKDRADDKKLDECLSEGIAMLEAERDQLRAEVEMLREDKARLDAIEQECWDVRFLSSPNGDAGDSSISIEIVGHFMAEPCERVVGENYNENLRAALDQAMTAEAYPPARPEYDKYGRPVRATRMEIRKTDP